jgi:hypothetical protein
MVAKDTRPNPRFSCSHSDDLNKVLLYIGVVVASLVSGDTIQAWKGFLMQEKQFVEMSDVLALRIECAECHGSISFPLNQLQRLNALITCPVCAASWNNQGDWKATVSTFANALGALRNWQKPQLTLSLEIPEHLHHGRLA